MIVTIALDFAALTGTASVLSPDHPHPYMLTIGFDEDALSLPWWLTDNSDADDVRFDSFAKAAAYLCEVAIEAARVHEAEEAV